MKLIIHTAGRYGKSGTYDALPKKWQERCWIMVPYRERKLWEGWPRLWVLPPNVKRLSPTRQYIIDNARQHLQTDYICMMDDDFINFGYRPDPKQWNLKVAKPHQVDILFKTMERWMKKDGIRHCGISSRVSNNRVEESWKENTRMTQLLCYHLPTVMENDFRFDRVPCMQDFDMTLQMLRAGFKNRVLYRGCTNARGTNQEGGCATYRTPDMQSRTARKLAKLHPDFVRLREKRTKDWPEPVTDVTIYWKKAAASGGLE